MRLPRWFVEWLRVWTTGARRVAVPATDRAAVFAAQHPDLALAISAASDARARRDTRGYHYASRTAMRHRTAAMLDEIRRREEAARQ